MTTNNDHFELRLSDSDWGIAKEWSIGVPIDGMVDPTGEYPKRDIFFGSSINQAARGAKINSISYGGSYYDVDLRVKPPAPSMFPFSQVNETPSGHSIELDDTPGNERILIKHRTGSGVELKPDGSIVISSKNRKVEVVRGDSKIMVSGTGEMVYEGNLNMKVNGDYNLDVNGNYNLNVGKNKKEEIDGSSRSIVSRVRSEITNESRDTRTYGPNVDLSLNGYTQIVKEPQNYASNERYRPALLTMVEGNVETNVSSDYRISASEHQYSAAGDFAVISQRLKMSSTYGFIGGRGVIHYGEVFTGPDKDSAPGGGVTYYGSLVGRAAESWTSKYSLFADEAYQAHISNYATIADYADESGKTKSQTYGQGVTGTYPGDKYPSSIDGATVKDGSKKLNKLPEFRYGVGNVSAGENSGLKWTVRYPVATEIMPGYVDSNDRPDKPEFATTQDIMLDRSVNGYKRVKIDNFDNLANQIGKLKYRRYFWHEPDVFEIRSKMRSFELYSLSGYALEAVTEWVNRGLLNPLFNKPAPATVEQIVKRTSVLKRYGRRLLGNPIENRSQNYELKITNPRANQAGLIPDPHRKWDSINQRRINSNMFLSPNVRISKFLGSIGSKVTLDDIPSYSERRTIFRNLTAQAYIIEQVHSADEFKDHNIVVSEGLYVPMRLEYNNHIKNENGVAADEWAQWNKWRMEGRAVVYQLLNTSGRIDWDATYDLAVWMRDNIVYDEIAIDYDSFNYDGSETISIVVMTPEVGDSYYRYVNPPKYKLSSWYNGKRMSADSLIKLKNPNGTEDFPGIPGLNDIADGTVTLSNFTGSTEGTTFTGESTNQGQQSSSASASFVFTEAKTVNVDLVIDSETDFDFARVFVNGVKRFEDSGNKSTSLVYSDVTELEIRYVKDSSVDRGDDKVVATVTWS